MNTLTAEEYRAVIARLGLNHEQAGTALGMNAWTSRRYARGGTIPDRTVRLLYLLLQEHERRRTG